MFISRFNVKNVNEPGLKVYLLRVSSFEKTMFVL